MAGSENGHTPEIPYRFDIIPIKQIVVDEYQRPLTSFVDKIEREFDPALVGTVCLSERSKTKFACIDGQTRVEGMRRLGMTHVPAIVYTNLKVPDEADLFAKFQLERRGMTSASRFKAQVIAQDPTALAINEIIEGLNFRVDANISEDGAGVIRAVAALEFVYWGARQGRRKEPHPELLARTLEAIRSAWPRLPDTAKSETMIKGLGLFLKTRQNIDDDRLAENLGKVTPTELAKRAQALREGHGMSGSSPNYMADAIDSQYRKKRS